MFREGGGMFNFIECLNRGWGQIAEKATRSQMAIDTTFNAIYAGHAHWRSSICRRNMYQPGQRATATMTRNV
jgi:hypothetical protein